MTTSSEDAREVRAHKLFVLRWLGVVLLPFVAVLYWLTDVPLYTLVVVVGSLAGAAWLSPAFMAPVRCARLRNLSVMEHIDVIGPDKGALADRRVALGNVATLSLLVPEGETRRLPDALPDEVRESHAAVIEAAMPVLEHWPDVCRVPARRTALERFWHTVVDAFVNTSAEAGDRYGPSGPRVRFDLLLGEHRYFDYRVPVSLARGDRAGHVRWAILRVIKLQGWSDQSGFRSLWLACRERWFELRQRFEGGAGTQRPLWEHTVTAESVRLEKEVLEGIFPESIARVLTPREAGGSLMSIALVAARFLKPGECREVTAAELDWTRRGPAIGLPVLAKAIATYLNTVDLTHVALKLEHDKQVYDDGTREILVLIGHEEEWYGITHRYRTSGKDAEFKCVRTWRLT